MAKIMSSFQTAGCWAKFVCHTYSKESFAVAEMLKTEMLVHSVTIIAFFRLMIYEHYEGS